MDNFYLIRHSVPEKDNTIPANQWRLSHDGRVACKNLADELKALGVSVLISSMEPKAIETAQITAKYLNIPSRIAFGLQEHDRSNVGFIPSEEQFNNKIMELMDKPSEIVFGLESANQARSRFTLAIEAILVESQEEKIAIVSHGTVMSLFIAEKNLIDPFHYWQNLKMPDIVKLYTRDYQIII